LDPGSYQLDEHARLTLPEKHLARLGLRPGDDVLLQETPEGLLLRPLAPPLGKVYVEPTTRCNLRCPMCLRQYWDEPETDLPWRNGDLRDGSLLGRWTDLAATQ